MTVGQNIKRIRERKKISQKELGKILGVSQQMIGQYENNANPPKLVTLRRISKALNTPLHELINGVTDFWQLVPPEDILRDLTTEKNTAWDYSEMEEFFAYSQNELEKILVEDFYLLNNNGKLKLVDYATDLTKIPKYQKEAPTHGNIRPQAAHNDHITDEPAESEKIQGDQKDMKRPDLLPNAAHERTDIEFTEEDRQADENMPD